MIDNSLLYCSLLRGVCSSSFVDAESKNRGIGILPLDLQNKIYFFIERLACMHTDADAVSLALKTVSLDVFDELEDGVRDRIAFVFFLCNPKKSPADDVLELLRICEDVLTERCLSDWQQENSCGFSLSSLIFDFLRSSLEMGRMNLSNLPDLFMNSELVRRLQFISLQENNISVLPVSLGFLRNLHFLNLYKNRIISLPDDFVCLENLEVLNLQSNTIEIFPEVICGLNKLRILVLQDNRLQSISENIEKLQELEYLNVSHNQISLLPFSLGSLSSLSVLDLAFNRISIFPDSLKYLSRLSELHLNNNRLFSVPGFVGNLDSLVTLDLSYNNLQNLPDTILQLPFSADVNLENSGLSSSVVNRLRGLYLHEDYRGPMLFFSVSEEDYIFTCKTLDESFAWLCLTAQQNLGSFANLYPRLSQHMLSCNLEGILTVWLSRLYLLQNRDANVEVGFADKILGYLSHAEECDSFRQRFFSVIEEATGTCGDRMALSVLHLGLQYKLSRLCKTDFKSLAEFILRGSWVLDKLEQIARDKVKTQLMIDEVEVYLAYPVMLKERLNLQIDVDQMLYFGCSGVTMQDLSDAAELIEGVLSDEESVLKILAENTDWQEALRFSFPVAFESFKRERDDALSKIIDENLAVSILDRYKSNILSLTEKVFKRFKDIKK